MTRSPFRFKSVAAFGLYLALAAPASAQNAAPPLPSSPSSEPSGASPAPANGPNQSPAQPAPPSPVLPILGCVMGLAGLLGAAYALSKDSARQKEIAALSRWKNDIAHQLRETGGGIQEKDLEEHIVGLLRSRNHFNRGLPPGMNLTGILRSFQEETLVTQVAPRLEEITTHCNSESHRLSEAFGLATQLEQRIDQMSSKLDGSTLRLNTLFDELKKGTREDLENFVYNIYNLIYAELQGEPTPTQLSDQFKRYGQLYNRMQSLKGDDLTDGTLQQFAEVTEKLRSKLHKAHQELQGETGAAREKLPYLDESRKGEAAQILDEYRRKIRLETAQSEELVKELSRAVLDYQRPLQTLFAGATFVDRENPARNESHLRLLEQVKSIFAQAGVEIYHPQQGETLDPARATHDFAGERHAAPFHVVQVDKLGLVVDGITEKGEVLVA